VQVQDSVTVFAKEHPYLTTRLALGAIAGDIACQVKSHPFMIVGATAGIVAAPIVAMWTLKAVGFGCAGVVKGSLAAKIQSIVYGAYTTGVFSTLQSTSQLGIGFAGTFVGATFGGVGGAIGGFVADEMKLSLKSGLATTVSWAQTGAGVAKDISIDVSKKAVTVTQEAASQVKDAAVRAANSDLTKKAITVTNNLAQATYDQGVRAVAQQTVQFGAGLVSSAMVHASNGVDRLKMIVPRKEAKSIVANEVD